MRPLSLYLLLCALLAAACHKSSTRTPGQPGQWQWVRSHFTLGPGIWDTSPSKDSTVVLQLNANLTYSVLLNGQIRTTGIYYDTIPQKPFNDNAVFRNPNVIGSLWYTPFGLNYSLNMSTVNDTLILNYLPLEPSGISVIQYFIPYH